MTLLAVCSRARAVALVVVDGETVCDVVRTRPKAHDASGSTSNTIRRVHQLVATHGVEAIVLEARQNLPALVAELHEALFAYAEEQGIRLIGLPLHDARRLLGLTLREKDNRDLMGLVLTQRPQLQGHVSILCGKVGIALSQRRRTVVLLAAALGLAAATSLRNS